MKHSFSKSHDTFLLNTHMWLRATLLDSADTNKTFLSPQRVPLDSVGLGGRPAMLGNGRKAIFMTS